VDLSWTAAIVLGGFVILRWILLGLGIAMLVRPVRDCPACFGPTFARQSLLRRIAPRFEWRFCARCGWQGPARRTDASDARLPDLRQPFPRHRS